MSSPPQGGPKLACLICRQRKVACDRKRPRCGLCSKNDFECEYKSRETRPGLRAGYVSKLEQHLLAVDARLKKVEAQLESNEQAPPQQGIAGPSNHLDDHMVEDTSPPGPPDFGNVPSAYTPGGDDLQVSPAGSRGDVGIGDFSQQDDQSFAPRSLFDSNNLVASEALTRALAEKSTETWFSHYHPWFPVVHEDTTKHGLRYNTPRYHYVLKAILAVVVDNNAQATPQQRQIADRVRDQVMHHGMTVASLQSVQALLILSNYYYNRGELFQFWNVLAMCQRMALHLDLHLLAINSESNMATAHRTTRSLVEGSAAEHEEAIRAYWMTVMLDSISTVGLSSRLSSIQVPKTAVLPCSESVWSHHHPIIDRGAPAQVQYPSMFSLCVMLAMEELGAIHQFSTKSYHLKDVEEKQEWQTEAQKLDERLTNWREEFVAAVFRLINSEKEYLPEGEMEPLITLTNCVLNTAIIVLMQQMAPFPKEIDSSHEPWPFATSRCVYACENMAAKVRRIAEDQLDSQSPHLILPVFAAARFYVVYSKALEADVPANLRSLAYYLHSRGKKSPLAQRFEAIIRTAVGEHRSPLLQCVLPVEFYDLRYSPLEIADLLQKAAEQLDPPGRDVRYEAAGGF